jgi:hypothetical protein
MEISRSPNFSIDVKVRRVVIGFTAGLISSVALVTILHSASLGLTLGTAVGALYGLAVRPTHFAYAESMFTAGSLGIPLCAVVSTIVPRTLAGNGPQWTADGMRRAVPSIRGVRAVWSRSGIDRRGAERPFV